MITQNKRLSIIMLIAALPLVGSFIAMQFTNEVNWSPFDFVLGGVLLFGTGLVVEFTLRMVKTTKYRLMLVAAILLVLFLVWAELAVGIFGTPFAGS